MSFFQLQIEEIPLVAHRMQHAIDDFKQFSRVYTPLIKHISKKLAEQWEVDEQNSKKAIERDSGKQKLTRWKERAKAYRKIALNEFSEATFQKLWRLRSDLEFVIASLRLSFYEDFIFMDNKWENEKVAELEPIVLRLKGPNTPKKKPITVADITYDIAEAIVEMFAPFTKKMKKIKRKLYKINLPNAVLEFEKHYIELQKAINLGDASKQREITELKQQLHSYIESTSKQPEGQKYINTLFQDLFLTREYISKLVQSANPRITYQFNRKF